MYLPLVEDGEEMARKKEAEGERLLEMWREKVDRRNWVLPGIGKRGGWLGAVWGKEGLMHPGMGEGVPRYCEIVVGKKGGE